MVSMRSTLLLQLGLRRIRAPRNQCPQQIAFERYGHINHRPSLAASHRSKAKSVDVDQSSFDRIGSRKNKALTSDLPALTVDPAAPTSRSSGSHQALNPPATTRPPSLDLPQRSSDETIYRYFYRLGKAYIAFYKAGFKGIHANYKMACAIPNFPGRPFTTSRREILLSTDDGVLSRADMQMLLRLRADVKVLPPFALVFICCGEFTPLLVPLMTSIVPPSLHLPTQTQTMREKARKRRQIARMEGPSGWRDIRNIWNVNPLSKGQANVQATVARRIAQELALYPQWWDKLPFARLHMKVIKQRLGKRLSELRCDDRAIIRDGGLKHLSTAELVMACDKRGLMVDLESDDEMKSVLERWLQDSTEPQARNFMRYLRINKA